ncbi:MAG: nucleotide sugar dehydrogenase [Bacillota bacterium]|nr:nucleotide sugar dehydrogenase [Bacillota bacterium]
MKICVIGLGYIGLPTAAMFAKSGHQVVGVDKNATIVEALNKGHIVIHEQHLDQLVKEAVAAGRLRGVSCPELADVFIIAVPTPLTEDKRADMRYVKAAAEEITPYLKRGNTVILESTSPLGTVDELLRPILEQSGLTAGGDFYLGHSPERVIPGQILYELVHNSRIAGGIDQTSAEKIASIYRSFVEGDIYLCDAKTAELAKLTENTFRDINIAFANELAQICESCGVNVWRLIELTNKHPRVNIHQPGPGVGGHCIAVDPWFIVETQPEIARLIAQARRINDAMPEFVAGRISSILSGVDEPRVAVLGVTYKPDVDDVRESPILHLLPLLRQRGFSVSAHDPYAGGADYAADALSAAQDCDLLLLGVHHSDYRQLDLRAIAGQMRRPNLLDTRNFFGREAAEAAGFNYYLLGERR